MTTAQMVAHVRTLLDEVGVTAGFWNDTEIYPGLADGQQAVANYFLNMYKLRVLQDLNAPIPQPLEALYTLVTATTTTGIVDRPADFWHLLSSSYTTTGGLAGTFYNCRIERFSASMFFNINNTYLLASITDPIVYDVFSTTQKFYFNPVPSATGAYALNYLKVPTAIASSVEPTLPVQTHNAIVFFAVAQMLFKDQRSGEAQTKMQDFMNELQLIG